MRLERLERGAKRVARHRQQKLLRGIREPDEIRFDAKRIGKANAGQVVGVLARAR